MSEAKRAFRDQKKEDSQPNRKRAIGSGTCLQLEEEHGVNNTQEQSLRSGSGPENQQQKSTEKDPSTTSEMALKAGTPPEATLRFALNRLPPEDFPSFVKQFNSTLTFPEKLMLLLVHIDRMCAKSGRAATGESVGWAINGKSFVIRNKEHFTSTWLPRFFSHAKFSSFTRKLYRWGFRKQSIPADGAQKSSEIVFTNVHFQRDNIENLSMMRSVTAAKMRGEQASIDAEASTADRTGDVALQDLPQVLSQYQAVETASGIIQPPEQHQVSQPQLASSLAEQASLVSTLMHLNTARQQRQQRAGLAMQVATATRANDALMNAFALQSQRQSRPLQLPQPQLSLSQPNLAASIREAQLQDAIAHSQAALLLAQLTSGTSQPQNRTLRGTQNLELDSLLGVIQQQEQQQERSQSQRSTQDTFAALADLFLRRGNPPPR